MHDTILARLESARKELLDLGLRNPLIHYKGSKAKGLHIVQEKASELYRLLVSEGKAMSFLGMPEKGEERKETINSREEQLQPTYTDNKIQTQEPDAVLQTKLLNTFYAARTGLEEQGVNTLFLSLGMLQWYEADVAQDPRLAPLILVPVTLERSTARERFRLKYSGEEVGHNLSLQAKLKAEFALALPGLPDEEDDISIDAYFAAVAEAVATQKRWNVFPDAIELGFFSFGKFMLYHDLDNDSWPEEERPVTHPILQSLFYTGFHDAPINTTDDAFIDKETNAHELFQVVDADSSQILAMLAVHEGKNLVIQGPPGTGKSQTITNIVVNAVGQGKKVLFVSEKMAALEVVKRRMDNIGLGEACLELHSQKAAKRELHQELKRILELGKPAVQKLKEEVALLSKRREELNDYSFAVNTEIEESHLTVHELYGYLLRINENCKAVLLPKVFLPGIQSWNAEKQQAAEAMAERIQARLKEASMPSELLFRGTGLRVLLPHETESLKQVLKLAEASVEKLKLVAKEVADSMSVALPQNREGAMKLAALVQMASINPGLHSLAIENRSWLQQKATVDTLLNVGAQLSKINETYADILFPEAWNLDALSTRSELKEQGEKWYRFLIGSYKNALKQLRSVCKVDLPKDNGERIKYAEDIAEGQRLRTTISQHEVLAKELFGNRWQGEDSDWKSLAEATAYLQTVHQQIADKTLSEEILSYLAKQENPEIARACYQSLVLALNEQGKSIHRVTEALQLNESLAFSTPLLQQAFGPQQQIFTTWLERLPELQQAISWNNLSDTAKEENLSCLIDASANWNEAGDFLKTALQKTWYEHLLEEAMNSHPSLRKFERASHEEVIRQFQRLDRLNLQYNRAIVALKHWEALPTLEAGGQMSVLKTEFNRKARHLPIRKLMQEAGLAIQAIKPVFMMSPLSIANFLPPSTLEFDLVIFDEASQVRPVEALGALLRGKQLVVVGDSKQLPPTSFFDSLNEAGDEEENITADMESILGLCDAQGAPQKMLRWHYRSRHESLIRLSNHDFYENRLVVFPSPGSKSRMGLFFHYLPDTVYDRGGTRTNFKEAEAVAEAVMEHARHHPKQSLGVVALSTAQRQAIQDALETRRKATPDLESFFKLDREEPFFVKNLENVQGDERDVMFISVGYGRTKEGYVSLSFGPLNNEGGEKRLNVLMTRAKQRCEVFTNITAADIDAERSQSPGIKTLKRFLHYAQHGNLHLPVDTGKESESPFEEGVAQQLESLGYTVHRQVGSQGFYLDLAIVDSAQPGRYLLGIECDGAAYHSARSARDRDRLRQQVLEGMGWRIYRIWSTDWFRHPEREIKRVVEAIEKARVFQHSKDDVSDEVTIDTAIEREHPDKEDELPLYETAVLPKEIASKELHQHSMGKLAGWIEEVVKKESPVHVDEMGRRIAEAADISRMGTRIKSQLLLAAKFAEGGHKIIIRDEFLWDPAMNVPVVRNRAALPASSRKIKYIAPQELQLAVEKVVREAIAISPEAAVTYVARLFGFTRVTEEAREDILAAINETFSQNKIGKEGEMLKPV